MNTPVIVGAGTSGLSLAYYLRQQGMRPVILEAKHAPGSAWRERHSQLRLNTHRWLSGLPGKPLPRKLGAFVRCQDYIAYLEQYAHWLVEAHGVDIRYGVSVRGLCRENSRWLLDTSHGALQAERVILATGPERVPYIPAWEGRDTTQIIQKHAADFGNAKDYHHQRVLIVGGANSGIDVANCLVRDGGCRSLAISMRQGTHLLPVRVLGLPTQLMAPLLTTLPLKVQDRVGAFMSRLCFGNLEKWGIRTPELGVCSRLELKGTAPGFDDGFVAAVKEGRIQVVPDVRRFERHSVEFVDGQSLTCDVVIFATGYRSGLSQLIGHLGLVDSEGRLTASALYGSDQWPDLWVFGMRPRLVGNICARVQEARKLAATIAHQSQ
ncbi:MAG: NAD(P)/FAD-dependent oxidoreductase [Marinobacter sp.]|nr:NAD(P)/FAD-dependent oxidoreductase [Marinobacter sp.]